MQTPYKLVYVLEVVVPMEYLVPSLRIVAFTDMDDTGVVRERLAQLVELEEEKLLALGYGSKRRSRKKRKNVNCAEDTVTVTGSK
jgi:hypothetical protein